VLWSHHHFAGRKEAQSVLPDELTARNGEFVTTAVALERLWSREMVNSICCRFGGWDGDCASADRCNNFWNLYPFHGSHSGSLRDARIVEN